MAVQQPNPLDPKKRPKKTAATVIDPVTGRPVEGGVGQTKGLADALRVQPAASPTDAAAQGASPDAAKMAGSQVAPTSRSASAPVTGGGSSGAPAAPESPRPQVGSTPTPEQRIAEATAAPNQQRGGAPTDLAAAMRYQAPAVDAGAIALGAAARNLTSSTRGLAGLDELMAKRREEALQRAMAPTPTIGSAADVGVVAPGAQVTADQFLADPRDAATRLADAQRQALEETANYKLTEEDLKSMGGREQLAAALGRDPVGMTAAQVREALSKAGATAQAESSVADAAAADLRLGANARSAADATAVAADEQTAGSLQAVSETLDEVAKGGSIRFGGSEIRLEEALADDRVSSWLKDFIAADPATRDRLAKDEPDLAEWAESNLPAVEAAVKSEREEAQKKADTANQESAWWKGAEDLGLDESSSSAIREAAKAGSDVAKALLNPVELQQEFPGIDSTEVGGQLRELAKTNPALYQDLVSGEYGDVADLVNRLGLGAAPNAENRNQWIDFVAHAREMGAITELERRAASGEIVDAESMLSVLFPQGGTIQDAEKLLRLELSAGKLSKTGEALRESLDPDHDGKLGGDEPIDLEALARAVARGTAGDKIKPLGRPIGDLMAKAQGKLGGEDSVTVGLADAMGNDQKFDKQAEVDAALRILTAGSPINPKRSAAAMYRDLEMLDPDLHQKPAFAEVLFRASQNDVGSALQQAWGIPAGKADMTQVLFRGSPDQVATIFGGRKALYAAEGKIREVLNAGGLDPFTERSYRAALSSMEAAHSLLPAGS